MSKIDDIIKVSEPYKSLYETTIENGIKYAKYQNVVFTSLVRDVSSVFDANINNIIDIGSTFFNTYKIVFFENDSIDDTKDKLYNITNKNSNINYISKDYNRPKFGAVKDKERTTALAEYRNICKDYIQNKYNNIDYIIVLDFDFADFSTYGLMNSFGWFSLDDKIKAIAGNSFTIRNIFGSIPGIWNYDCWAYRGSWWCDMAQYPPSSYNPMLWFGLWIPPVGSPPFNVNSAFGGCCIYKSNYYYGGSYDGSDCEHVRLHHSLYKKFTDFQLFLNPAQRILFP